MPNITIHHEEVPDEFMHYVGQDWRRIIDIQFNVHSSSESGDAHEFSTSVINHQTLFDFEAYKKDAPQSFDQLVRDLEKAKKSV